ncbi:uncharacterized protein LOC131005965 isoform X2 [Salvia miltiorrhiza]|uniref:uncharacterized protein LOC131005965 isoform X2 n=1 Tax=Salvia miltiorrhiza TaxID=226208 RepID=UPI0025ACC3B5|nr:uncharacterized protein LOC131005965 isoform X2 [Salvia miltiorrhiza]
MERPEEREIERHQWRPDVYSWIAEGLFHENHHGIYMGDDRVVHFTRRKERSCPACEMLEHGDRDRGVIVSCLDCFIDSGLLGRREYGVSTEGIAESDPVELVLERADQSLLANYNNEFGEYDALIRNSSEKFAFFCKTEGYSGPWYDYLRQRGELQPGDHIRSWRNRHGIYTGKHLGVHRVVYFTGAREREACSSCRSSTAYSIRNSGVIVSCLKCFLHSGPGTYFYNSLQFYRRHVNNAAHESSPAVVERAFSKLFENGFGEYDEITNNDEHFVIYCETGHPPPRP